MALEQTAGVKRPNNYFDGLPVGPRHKAVFFVIMFAFFIEQMDNSNWSYISTAVFNTWGLAKEASDKAMGLVVMWYFIGLAAGGICGGLISDYIGRRKTFMLAIIMFSCGSFVNGLPIDNLYIFLGVRAITGFGVFCLITSAQVYITEISPSESRGKWLGLVGAVGLLGIPCIGLLCRIIVPLNPEAWRIIFYIGGSGLIAWVFSYKLLMESPRWLISKGRKDEAEAVMFKMTGQHIDLSEAASKLAPKTSLSRNLKDMFGRQYLKRTLTVGFVLLMFNPVYFAFTTWMGKLLSDIPAIDPATGLILLDAAGKQLALYSQADVLTMLTVIIGGLPVGCFVSSLIADKGGRKIPIAIMIFCTSIMMFIFTRITSNFYMTFIVGFLVVVCIQSGGYILYVYVAELYPTYMRNTANGLHHALGRSWVSVSSMIIPLILLNFGGVVNGISRDIPVLFTIGSVMLLFPGVIILIFGPRTGGKSLEEIS